MSVAANRRGPSLTRQRASAPARPRRPLPTDSERIRVRAFQCFVLNCLLFIGSLCVMDYLIMPIIVYVRTPRCAATTTACRAPCASASRSLRGCARAFCRPTVACRAALRACADVAPQPVDERGATARPAASLHPVPAALGLPRLLHLVPSLLLMVRGDRGARVRAPLWKAARGEDQHRRLCARAQR